MNLIKIILAGLLAVLAISALSSNGSKDFRTVTSFIDVADTPLVTTNKTVICGKTPDIKEQLESFTSLLIGVNRDEDTNKVRSLVEVYTQDKKWLVVEHFTEGMTCVIGVGEEWLLNYNHKAVRKQSGLTI